MPSQNTRVRLVPLSTHVFLFRPTVNEASRPLTHPSVILLFGWMFAKPSHLHSYVDQLHARFSTSTILLVKCADTGFYIKTHRELQRVLRPAVHLICEAAAKERPFRGILLHVLSNGGGFQLLEIRRMLAKAKLPDSTVHSLANAPLALVLDSVPGDNGLSSLLDLVVPSNPVLATLTMPAGCALYFLIYAYNALAGNPPFFPELRATLNTCNTLALPTYPKQHGAHRLYIYSPSDKIVSSERVEAHIAEAKEKAFDVMVQRFDSSAHVMHARKDPERYWKEVENLWFRAVAASEDQQSSTRSASVVPAKL